MLQEGNNTILVEVTNVNGYTKKAKTEIRYPQQKENKMKEKNMAQKKFIYH